MVGVDEALQHATLDQEHHTIGGAIDRAEALRHIMQTNPELARQIIFASGGVDVAASPVEVFVDGFLLGVNSILRARDALELDEMLEGIAPTSNNPAQAQLFAA